MAESNNEELVLFPSYKRRKIALHYEVATKLTLVFIKTEKLILAFDYSRMRMNDSRMRMNLFSHANERFSHANERFSHAN